MSRQSYEAEYYGRQTCRRCGEFHRHNEPCADLAPDRRCGCAAVALVALAIAGIAALCMAFSSCDDADARRLPSGERIPAHVTCPKNYR